MTSLTINMNSVMNDTTNDISHKLPVPATSPDVSSVTTNTVTETITATQLASCPRSASGERLQAEVNRLQSLMQQAEGILEHLRRQFLEASQKAAAQDRADHRVLLGAPARLLLEADDVWREQTMGEEWLLNETERDVCHIIRESIARAERKCQAVTFDAEDMRDIDALFTKFAAAIELGPEYPNYSRSEGDPGDADFAKMIAAAKAARDKGLDATRV